jgi:hypothetical protein
MLLRAESLETVDRTSTTTSASSSASSGIAAYSYGTSKIVRTAVAAGVIVLALTTLVLFFKASDPHNPPGTLATKLTGPPRSPHGFDTASVSAVNTSSPPPSSRSSAQTRTRSPRGLTSLARCPCVEIRGTGVGGWAIKVV